MWSISATARENANSRRLCVLLAGTRTAERPLALGSHSPCDCVLQTAGKQMSGPRVRRTSHAASQSWLAQCLLVRASQKASPKLSGGLRRRRGALKAPHILGRIWGSVEILACGAMARPKHEREKAEPHAER